MSNKITWYGHSALSLETGDYHILLDPYLSKNPASKTSAESVEADFIMVTHGHYDHIGDTVEIAKRTGAMVICNFEISNWLEERGVSTHAQHLGGGYQYPFGYVKLTLAFHGSGLPDGSYGGTPAGFLVYTNDGKKLYFAGDTALFSDMKLIGDAGLDLAVLPVGDNFTMGPDDAFKAVQFLHPKHVIPVHYDTWELIRQDLRAWVARVQSGTDTQVHRLEVGESFTLPE
jgi:L-ascorbate metabolism protein UlaG (beta-lactamase superfamily)